MSNVRIDHIAFLTPGNYADEDAAAGFEQTLELFSAGEALGYDSAWVRQRHLETADRCASPVHLPGATPGATGTFGHCTARDPLRSAAGDRAHDGTGRAALPHTSPSVRDHR